MSTLPTDPAERLAALQTRLQRVPNFDSTEIPPEAVPLIRELKHASRSLVEREIRSATQGPQDASRGVSDLVLEKAVEDAALRAGVNIATPDGNNAAVGTWYPSITRSKKDPRYIIAGWYFTLPCGSDGGYLVYEQTKASLRLLMTLQSSDYEAIDGAFWQLSFALPPPGRPADFFFVATRITPWCTSALRKIHVMIARPGATPDEPKMLVNELLSYHLFGSYAVDVTAKEVKLTYTPESPNSKAVRRFRIDSGSQ